MSEAQEQQEELAEEMKREEGEPETLVADTAFVVFVQDGIAYATNEVERVEVGVQGQKLAIEPGRKASPDDLYRYSMEVAKDVQVSQTAAASAKQIFDITMQLQKQQQAEGSSGLHVPGRS